MTQNLQKYYNIMSLYQEGAFGKEHLTMGAILHKAEEPDLLDKMSIDELQYLIDNTSGITKQMFMNIKAKKV